MWSIKSERLKKFQLLSKKNNNIEYANALIAQNRDIIEEKNTICINLGVVTTSSNNIGIRAEGDILFFDKNGDTLEKSWQQIICQAQSTVNRRLNLYKSQIIFNYSVHAIYNNLS